MVMTKIYRSFNKGEVITFNAQSQSQILCDESIYRSIMSFTIHSTVAAAEARSSSIAGGFEKYDRVTQSRCKRTQREPSKINNGWWKSTLGLSGYYWRTHVKLINIGRNGESHSVRTFLKMNEYALVLSHEVAPRLARRDSGTMRVTLPLTSFRRHSGCVSTLSRAKPHPKLVYVAVP